MFVNSIHKSSSLSTEVENTSRVNKALRPITHAYNILNKQMNKPQSDKPISLFVHEKKMLKTLVGTLRIGGFSKHPIYHYCQGLINSASCEMEKADNFLTSYYPIKQHIAHVIFLANQDLDKTARLLKSMDPIEAVKKEVDAQIDEIKKRLTEIFDVHTKVGLQSPEEAYFVAFHLEIFKALVLPDGRLNIRFIPTLIEGLLSDSSDELDWKKETKTILEKIQNSKVINTKASSIKKPEANNTPAVNLIRLTLDIPPEKEISDQDARTVATSGMIPVRQGPVGNCFVICNAIWFITAVLEKTLTDFSQIIENGELIRMQGDQKMRYPIDFDISDSDLDNTFQVSKNGLLNQNAYLWESPGLQSACLHLGLKDSKEALEKTLNNLFKGNKESRPLEISAREFLSELAKLSVLKKSQEYLSKMACLAFSSKTNMPILHAWTSALAAMDQSVQSSSLHEKLNACWKAVFSDTWKDLSKEKKISETLLTKIQEIFYKQICGRILIEYDESIQTSLAADGNSTEGSFVYFERNINEVDSLVKPIHSYKDLTQYAKNTLQVTEQELNKELSSTPESYKEVLLKIKALIDTEDKFADLVLSNYDPSLKTAASLEEKWNKFQVFSQIGGDNAHVFEVAMGFPLPPPTSAGEASAKERLVTIIQFLRDREKSDRFIESPEEERYEMDSDDHAFTLPAKNTSLLPYVKSQEKIEEMIENLIYKPCQSVSQAIITEKQKNALIEESLRLIPKELDLTFAHGVQNMPGKTIFEYTKALFDSIVKLHPGIDASSQSTLLAKFTNIVLYKVLDENQLKIIRDHTVLGPDTNWVDDDQQKQKLLEIFFAFTLNPVTNQIEFFEIDENASALYALSQADWIGGPWNLYGLNLEKDKHEAAV